MPATDVNDINTVSTPYQLPNSTAYPSYARVSVGNAVAAIEGYEAIQYLTQHHDWSLINTTHDGLITAQQLQTFVNNAASMGVPEAGAMAALLGGTATYGPVLAGINNEVFNENPDQPGAEQRRFNFFDYAADGQLNGSISINEFKMLGRTLLPSPDAFTIVDRQRAAANGFLLAPSTPRNFVGLKYLKPSFLWIPKSTVARYRHISPDQFTVGRGEKGGEYLPVFTLFSPTEVAAASSTSTPDSQVVGLTETTSVGGRKFTVNYMVNAPTRSDDHPQPHRVADDDRDINDDGDDPIGVEQQPGDVRHRGVQRPGDVRHRGLVSRDINGHHDHDALPDVHRLDAHDLDRGAGHPGRHRTGHDRDHVADDTDIDRLGPQHAHHADTYPVGHGAVDAVADVRGGDDDARQLVTVHVGLGIDHHDADADLTVADIDDDGRVHRVAHVHQSDLPGTAGVQQRPDDRGLVHAHGSVAGPAAAQGREARRAELRVVAQETELTGQVVERREEVARHQVDVFRASQQDTPSRPALDRSECRPARASGTARHQKKWQGWPLERRLPSPYF